MGFYKLKKNKIYSPFSNKGTFQLPNWRQRIDDNRKKGYINVVFVDGRGQSGKSTWCDYCAGEYDKEYILVYEAEEVFNLMEKYRKILGVNDLGQIKKPENLHNVLYKVIFWDEPQTQITKMFWDERNQVISQLTGTWGFLKNDLWLATPDTSGLPPILMRNVTCKFTIKVFLKGGQLIRRYWCYIPHKNSRTEKWFWGSAVETGIIPESNLNKEYFERKYHNFFNVQLKKWNEELVINKQKKKWWLRGTDKALPPNSIVNLLKNKTIDREFALKELERGGFDFKHADLFLEAEVPTEYET